MMDKLRAWIRQFRKPLWLAVGISAVTLAAALVQLWVGIPDISEKTPWWSDYWSRLSSALMTPVTVPLWVCLLLAVFLVWLVLRKRAPAEEALAIASANPDEGTSVEEEEVVPDQDEVEVEARVDQDDLEPLVIDPRGAAKMRVFRATADGVTEEDPRPPAVAREIFAMAGESIDSCYGPTPEAAQKLYDGFAELRAPSAGPDQEDILRLLLDANKSVRLDAVRFCTKFRIYNAKIQEAINRLLQDPEWQFVRKAALRYFEQLRTDSTELRAAGASVAPAEEGAVPEEEEEG